MGYGRIPDSEKSRCLHCGLKACDGGGGGRTGGVPSVD